MASSKVLASSSSSDANHHQQPSFSSTPLESDQLCRPIAASTVSTAASTSAMDEFLRNVYIDTTSTVASSHQQQYPQCFNSFSLPATNAVGVISVRDVDVSAEAWTEAEMTLEDFLTKGDAGPMAARAEDDVLRLPAEPPHLPRPCFDVRPGLTPVAGGGGGDETTGQFHLEGFENGVAGTGLQVGGSGRPKRRLVAVDEIVVDKATQQKQRRMIKNRESAARSRERKQAYTVELETLVTQLEEENALLHKEEAQQNRQRFKQLMENLIPVAEKRPPRRTIRRVNSMEW